MKRMLSQKLIDQLTELVEAQGIDWVKQMKELISYIEEDDLIDITKAVQFEDVIYLTLSDILNDGEQPYFPALTDQAGKCVVVNEDQTGYEYKDPSSFMTQLTHSFVELDSTLQTIINQAISDGDTDGVACSEAQWLAIKSLLDKSLYLNYAGWSMIKGITDGLGTYIFGVQSSSYGARLSFNFAADEPEDSKLFASYEEL